MRKNGNQAPKLQIIRLPQPAHHALQGLLFLARRAAGRSWLAAEAACSAGLPAGALAKTFQRLASRGLLLARRGPGGGYELARPARRITLAEIVDAASEGRPARCLMEDRVCGRDYCVMHDAATRADGILRRKLESVTLEAWAVREAAIKGGRR